MGFTLEKVVPWGRSYDEYVSMFGLTEVDLGLRILGCGDGPAAFNSALLRVSREVRVFPLLALDGTLSPHLNIVSVHLANHGFKVEVHPAPYEFQRGGNEMLVIKPV